MKTQWVGQINEERFRPCNLYTLNGEDAVVSFETKTGKPREEYQIHRPSIAFGQLIKKGFILSGFVRKDGSPHEYVYMSFTICATS